LSNEKNKNIVLIPYREFDDEKGRAVVEETMAAMPDAWKADALSSSLKYNGVSHFHRPGIVYAVDLVVAVPNAK
jgi:hypothetical protein